MTPLVRHPADCPHLFPLGTTPWAAWRWIALRGAGFPVDDVLALADEDASRAADELIVAEAERDRTREQALDTIRHDPRLAPADRKAASRDIRSGLVPDGLDLVLKGRLATAQARCDAAGPAYARLYTAARARAFAHLQSVAGDDRFREALTWQNRQAVHAGIASLLRSPAGADAKKDRRNGELVAGYLQRYCTKNDTIGFFGPVGWARVEDGPDAIRVRVGEPDVVNRTVCFEVWAIDALASAMAGDRSLQPWIAPLREPQVVLSNDRALVPGRPAVRLSPPERIVLLHCDGQRTAQELAADLRSVDPRVFPNDVLVYLILEGLRAKHLIVWTAAVPIDAWPERSLRAQLGKVSDTALRTRSLAQLDELERARDAVAQAAGNAARLDTAMANLEATFTRLTARAATRAVHNADAGRTLVYEDCRRNTDVVVGPALLDALAPALGLLLTSARWLTSACAERFGARLEPLFDELAVQFGGNEVALPPFWAAAQEMVMRDRPLMASEIEHEFQDRWARILNDRTHVASADIAAQVATTFAAGHHGWNGGRYQSVDLMIAARDADAIAAGHYQPVLGELHVGVNTLALGSFVSQHPSPQELCDATDRDLPEPRVVVQFPKWLGMMARSRPVLFSPHDYFLRIAAEPYAVDPARTLATGSLVVARGTRGLEVRSLDGTVRVDANEVFADLMMGTIANAFRIRPRDAHVPRVTMDQMVIHRESWSFAAAELEIARQMPGVDRFRAARAFRRRYQLPRQVFVRVPVEPKPVYLDFDSSYYVDQFARIVRRTVASELTRPMVTLTEMLPAPDDAWLSDSGGRKYTSEFRIVMVDRTGAV